MIGRALVKACLATVGLGMAGQALAADYDGALPGEGFNGFYDCLYARIDGGVTLFDRAEVEQFQVLGYDPSFGFSDGVNTGLSAAVNEEIEDTAFFEGGFGCQLSDSFRVDVTGGMRLKSTLSDPYPDSLSGEIASQHVFISGYWDITNYAGFTPYVGGGVGAAHHEISSLTFPVGAADGSNFDFAYHVTFGMAYDLTPNLKFDFAYRFVNLGDAHSDTDFGDSPDLGPITVSNIEAHEIKLGIRYHMTATGR